MGIVYRCVHGGETINHRLFLILHTVQGGAFYVWIIESARTSLNEQSFQAPVGLKSMGGKNRGGARPRHLNGNFRDCGAWNGVNAKPTGQIPAELKDPFWPEAADFRRVRGDGVRVLYDFIT